MSQFVEAWSKTTKAIYNGVLLYSLAGILYAILDPIDELGDFFGGMMFFTGSRSGLGGLEGLSIVCNVLLGAIILGYILFLTGLGGFSHILPPRDKAAVCKIRNSVILALVAEIFDFIPFLGWVGSILSIIAFIMMIIGYSSLKNSMSFPRRARSGASKLFTSMILLIIGAILGFIPFVGKLLEMPFSIIAFILTLTGWAAIKNTIPTEDSY